MPKKYIVVLIGGILVLFIGTLLWFGVFQQEESLPVEDQIAPFELEDALAEANYSSDNGKIKLVSFIFINCPDGVCPMTMVDFHELQEELKAKKSFGSEVELLTITFDPERDTAEALQEYAASFNVDPAGWKVLRGSPEEIQALSDDLRFFYGFSGEDGFHSTMMFLLDGDHQVREYYTMSKVDQAMDKEGILKAIQSLVKEK